MQSIGDRSDEQAIVREAKVMSKLSHPAVVRVFGLWRELDEDFGRIFMVRPK